MYFYLHIISEVTSVVSQQFPNQAILITDARCYSSADLLAAAWHDNKCGRNGFILGMHATTGGGGAQVVSTDTAELKNLESSELHAGVAALKKNNIKINVAIRRSIRSKGSYRDFPIENVGVPVTHLYYPSEDTDDRELYLAAAHIFTDPNNPSDKIDRIGLHRV